MPGHIGINGNKLADIPQLKFSKKPYERNILTIRAELIKPYWNNVPDKNMKKYFATLVGKDLLQ